VVSQVVNLRLAVDVPRKERRTTEKEGDFRENPRKGSRIPQRKRRTDLLLKLICNDFCQE